MYANKIVNKFYLILLSSISSCSTYIYADDLQFNTDLLDLTDKKNIELGLFSKPGFIMPGSYLFKVNLNNQYLTEKKIEFKKSNNDENLTEACLTRDIVHKFALTKEIQKKLQWDHETDCLIIESIEGLTVKSDLPKAIASIDIPQAYLEYRSDNWDPYTLWDEGINGAILDYNIAGNSIISHQSGEGNSTFIGANGTAGANIGAWRFRADWQANYQQNENQSNQNDFHWNRFYAYRALPEIKSRLIVGENYLSSDMFDSFRFTGASLSSDTSMLPPNLRGYAPQVTGVAQTNARVTVRQLGRILYQTQVPAGPFKIQDLNNSISGTLNISIEEENGTTREFDLDTASIPFLTRPGSVQYKTSIGRPSTYDHKVEGDLFFAGEFSWGVTNGWSLFGGSLNSKDYNALSVGVGRDLLSFGAISFDMTQSFANIDKQESLEGRSYRINYAKRFEALNSQIQFAGYRFSERDFVSMSDFLVLNGNIPSKTGRSKEMYNISLSQNLPSYQTSLSFNLNHQTYWDSKSRDYYSVSINRNLNIGSIKNASLSLSAYRSEYETKDQGAYFSLTLPLSSGARTSYSLSRTNNDTRGQVGYSDRFNKSTSYQVNASYSDKFNSSVGAFVSHTGERTQVNANINYVQDLYTSIGASSQGGLTITSQGIDLHRNSTIGGTRVMIDTDKVSGIPVDGNGLSTTSNYFGKAVVTDIGNYTRNQIKVDINKLPKNAEVIDSVIHTTLTEGAIGFQKISVISGQKKMVTLKLSDGNFLSFGTPILNSKSQNVGMVDNDGLAYLSGIRLGEKMVAQLGNREECSFSFTEINLAKDENNALLCE